MQLTRQPPPRAHDHASVAGSGIGFGGRKDVASEVNAQVASIAQLL
jgi:hypothetical protein